MAINTFTYIGFFQYAKLTYHLKFFHADPLWRLHLIQIFRVSFHCFHTRSWVWISRNASSPPSPPHSSSISKFQIQLWFRSIQRLCSFNIHRSMPRWNSKFHIHLRLRLRFIQSSIFFIFDLYCELYIYLFKYHCVILTFCIKNDFVFELHSEKNYNIGKKILFHETIAIFQG